MLWITSSTALTEGSIIKEGFFTLAMLKHLGLHRINPAPQLCIGLIQELSLSVSTLVIVRTLTELHLIDGDITMLLMEPVADLTKSFQKVTALAWEVYWKKKSDQLRLVELYQVQIFQRKNNKPSCFVIPLVSLGWNITNLQEILITVKLMDNHLVTFLFLMIEM